jgi:glycerophosphoryl diester phosphodiesterase
MGEAVVAEVRAADAVDRVCAAGYGQHSIDAVRAALPRMATSASHPEARLAVYRSLAGWPVRDVPYQHYQVPERAGLMPVATRRFIRHAHGAGIKVQIWTVDDERDMERLLRWGADGLISNRPDLAVRARDAFVRRHPASPML